MSLVVDVAGLGRVIDPYTGEPTELRWLAIHADGRVVERSSVNLIGWSVVYEMWVQFRLLRDVGRTVEPANLAWLPTEMIHTWGRGVVVAGQLPNRAPNRVATAMLAAVGVEHAVTGPVAWLGDLHPGTGLHADLAGVEELRVLAAHCRGG